MSCKHVDGCIDCLREEIAQLRKEKEHLRSVLDRALEGLQAAKEGADTPEVSRPEESDSPRTQAVLAVTKVNGGKMLFRRVSEPKLITVPEMLTTYGLARSVVYTAITKGVLSHKKDRGGRLMVAVEDAEAFVQSRGKARKRLRAA